MELIDKFLKYATYPIEDDIVYMIVVPIMLIITLSLIYKSYRELK